MSDANFLEIRNISKSFGVVQALKNVSFSVKKGEIHTFLGENGAGKSTLVKIIMGEQPPDEGEILIDGEAIKVYSPLHAHSLGISMVHQELAVFENMTVAENIFPTCDFVKGGLIDKREMNKRAQEAIDIFHLDLEPDTKVDSLTLAQQQMVEILRSISAGQRIILLDEPTSGLNKEEAERMMETLRRLKNEGITIIYISHRINEVLGISDRITVLRDGEYIHTFDDVKSLSEIDLVSKMVGREMSLVNKKQYKDNSGKPVIYSVKGMNKRNAAYDINFEVRAGEVLGFFGLEGSGTESVSRMLYGLEARDSGEVEFKGEKLHKITPTALVRKKILYLNNNRKMAGLLLNSSAATNMSIPVQKEMSRFTLLNFRKIKDYTRQFIKAFNIVIPSIETKPRNLSGGNQQKLMLSICLGPQPELLFVNEPTRGIDVGAKAEIHRFLLELAEKGVSMVVFSSELPELLSLADRVIIMKNQAIVGEVFQDEITEESIMTIAAGGV